VHSDFIIVEWTDAGTSEWDWIVPLHVHHADDEAWYVLVMTPKIRALVEALHKPGAGDYAAIFSAHDTELLS
jgi:hypothetical protein